MRIIQPQAPTAEDRDVTVNRRSNQGLKNPNLRKTPNSEIYPIYLKLVKQNLLICLKYKKPAQVVR